MEEDNFFNYFFTLNLKDWKLFETDWKLKTVEETPNNNFNGY